MQQKASKEAKEKAWREEQAAAEKRRAQGIAAQARVKKGPRRRPQNPRTRDPICVSVSEALAIIPWGRAKLFAELKSGRVKSRLVDGKRAINYRSLVETFEPLEEPVALTEAELKEVEANVE